MQYLIGFLAAQQNQPESKALSPLVQNPKSEAWSRPYEEGYRLAEDCRDELGIDPDQVFVDMEGVLASLDIKVRENALETSAIRGVAVAGNCFAPAILVNTTSFYNNNEVGKRFTLAHELCHILYDRTRAKKLSHLSGPWASSRTEKRANAFAAMFLAPPSAIRQRLADISPEAVRALAGEVGMGVTALVEHLYNVNLINDAEREQLRQI
jgi:Zn-dependent peptidase ImmA (M78 family)